MSDVSAKDLRLILEQYSQFVVKAVFLINGGASVAVLTYLGTRKDAADLSSLSIGALLVFAVGVLFGGLITFLTHRAMYWFYQEAQAKEDGKTNKEIDRLHENGKRYYRRSNTCAFASFGLFAAGIGLFAYSLSCC